MTFNPREDELGPLLDSLRPQVHDIVVVDNGSANFALVQKLGNAHNCHVLPLPKNRGIAAAQNRGVAWALERGCDYVLLSDQDSVAAPDMAQRLLECFANPAPAMVEPDDEVMEQFPPSALNGPVGAVGPVPSDDRGDGSGGDLVYSFTKWGARRTQVPQPGTTLAVPFVLASGCLISRDALLKVGPMDEALFIDHVDLAWCLRAIQKGFRILVCGDARIYHSLGDDVARVPGRKRAVHLHSPIRNYYMMRNTLLLQSAPFLPPRWKRRYLWWMAKYMGYYTLAPGRSKRIPMMARAVADGLAGRSGELADRG